MKKTQYKIYFTLLISTLSLLLFLPIINGLGCNTAVSYQTDNYNVTGYCKTGLLELYFLPKNSTDKTSSHPSSYLSVKALYMPFYNNSAVYIYSINDMKMQHTQESIEFLVNMKYNHYRQFYSTTNGQNLKLAKKDGQVFDLLTPGRTALF